jgi:hypothetical protein
MNPWRPWAKLSDDGVYRYVLTRTEVRWEPPTPLALFIMLNPSTADAKVDDATIRRCTGFARRWGCGGLAVLNLFALRSTSPAALATAVDPVGPDNDRTIAGYLWHTADVPSIFAPVVVAWGRHGTLHDRDLVIDDMIRRAGHKPMCLSRNNDGTPGHPLRLPNSAPLRPYTGR